MRLLNIESSPRGSRSASIAVASAFLEAYRQACPGVVIDTLNVWEEKLPEFDQEAIGAKYKGVNSEPIDQAETAVWNKNNSCGSVGRTVRGWHPIKRGRSKPREWIEPASPARHRR
jgi:FMN-dependent NADH-azoreductase